MVLANCYAEVSFGGFQLNDGSFHVDDLDVYSTPARQVARLPHLTRPGSVVSQRRDPERTVRISGSIPARGKSIATMERLLDRLKARLISGVQDLKVGYLDGRYFANAEIDGEINVNWELASRQRILWTAQFLCVDPYMYAVDAETLTDNTALASEGGGVYSKTLSVPVGGSANSFPIITVVMPVAGPYGMTQLILRNTTYDLNYQTKLDRTFADNDEVIADSPAISFKLNNVEHDFSGRLLEFVPNVTNSLIIRATATSTPTLNMSVVWTPRWY